MPDVDQVRTHAEAHARAVVEGDMQAVLLDFADEAKPLAREMGRALPRPVTGAAVLSVTALEEGCSAEIRYDGADAPVVLRSTWAERDGRPRIIAGGPA